MAVSVLQYTSTQAQSYIDFVLDTNDAAQTTYFTCYHKNKSSPLNTPYILLDYLWGAKSLFQRCCLLVGSGGKIVRSCGQFFCGSFQVLSGKALRASGLVPMGGLLLQLF